MGDQRWKKLIERVVRKETIYEESDVSIRTGLWKIDLVTLLKLSYQNTESYRLERFKDICKLVVKTIISIN